MNINSDNILTLKIVALLSLGVMAIGCSSSSSSDGAAASTTSSYNGIGSKWTASFDSAASTFVITYDSEPDGTVDMTVNGTYVEYSNHIRKLTVTSATGTNAPSVGDTAEGIEMPGYAFFLKPLSATSEPIVMLQAGSCPTAAFTANWSKASFTEAPTANSDSFGNATFAYSGGVYTATIGQYSFGSGTSLGEHAGPVGTCASGELSFNDGSGTPGTMYLTSNGGALVKSSGGIIFASPKFTGATVADLAGDYTVIIFSGNRYSSTPTIFMGKITFAADGSGTGGRITDVAADTTVATGVSFSLTAGTDGLFSGSISNGAGSNPIHCVLSRVDSEQLLACNGAGSAADGSGNYNSTFFMLGMKR